MITVPVACIVDASVAVKLVITEVHSNVAHGLFAHLGADPMARFMSPNCFMPSAPISSGSKSSFSVIRRPMPD
jgi:hypothetical protein